MTDPAVTKVAGEYARGKIEFEAALKKLARAKDEQFKQMIIKEDEAQKKLGNWSAELSLGNLLKKLETWR